MYEKMAGDLMERWLGVKVEETEMFYSQNQTEVIRVWKFQGKILLLLPQWNVVGMNHNDLPHNHKHQLREMEWS